MAPVKLEGTVIIQNRIFINIIIIYLKYLLQSAMRFFRINKLWPYVLFK